MINQSYVFGGITALVLAICCFVIFSQGRKPSASAPPAASDGHSLLRQTAALALANVEKVERTFAEAQEELLADGGIDALSAMEELRVAMRCLREVATEDNNGLPYEVLERKFAAANEDFLRISRKVAALIEEQQVRKAAKRIRQANELGFAGIDFDTSPNDFVQRFPGETPNWTNKEQQHSRVRVYCLADHKPSRFASFSFVDEKLYEITFSYDWLTIGELGGRQAIIDRLAHRIGPPNRSKDLANHLAGWDFPERKIDVYLWSEGELGVSIEHVGLHALREQRRAKFEAAEQRRSERKDAGF